MTNSFAAAIFFREKEDKIEFYLDLNKTLDVYEHLQCDDLSEDIDPSLNYIVARDLYSKIYNFKATSLKDYMQLLTTDEHFSQFSDILYQINQCDTLIDGNDFKIFFLNYNKFFEEKLKLDKVDLTLESISKETKQFFEEHNIVEYVNKNLHAEKTLFMIINTEDKKYWKNVQEALYQGAYQSENQKWISYVMPETKTIDEEILKKVKGFTATGGHYNAYDDSLPWVTYTYDIFNKIIYPEQENNQKLIGICWSHQAIAHACGGKAAQMPHKNFYSFRDQINFIDVETSDEKNYSKMLPKPFYSVKVQGDYVEELPKDGILICSSDKVITEGIAIRDKALTFQFHPEFNKTILFKILTELTNEGIPVEDNVKLATESFSKDHHLSNKDLNVYLKKFLAS